jgi:N-acyl-D-aspartate/D-glutamate deacylase
MGYDAIFKGGTVVDGSGSPGFRADVAVKDGQIAAVGDLKTESGRIIDAEGCTVAPGFIDMHTHYDVQLCWDPLATSSCWHGVTTVLTGNCGYGIAPLNHEHRDYVAALMSYVEGISLDVLESAVDWKWNTFGEYLKRLRGNGLGVNVAPQVPHSPLRYYVMGEAACEREATQDEIARMKQVVRESIAEGAIGFSTLQAEGRLGAWNKPIPSEMASIEELRELGSVLSEFRAGGVITISPKPGTSRISPEYREFLMDWSKAANRPVVWSQFMHRWDLPDMWKDLIGFMKHAEDQGSQVYAVAKCQRLDLEFNLVRTGMFDYYPTWKEVLGKPHEEKKRLMADPATRAKLREEATPKDGDSPGRRPEIMEIKTTVLEKNKSLQGRRVVDVAAEQGKHYVDCFIDLAVEEDLATQFIYAGIMNGDPAAVGEIIKAPYCLPGSSDAGAHLNMDCGVDFSSLLLGHWVREKGVMSLEEAVRRLTSLSANVLGLTDRGCLEVGKAADVVVFNPETIQAMPREMVNDIPGGNERIIQRVEGVETVMVNGQVLLDHGAHTGDLPGMLLGATGPR